MRRRFSSIGVWAMAPVALGVGLLVFAGGIWAAVGLVLFLVGAALSVAAAGIGLALTRA